MKQTAQGMPVLAQELPGKREAARFHLSVDVPVTLVGEVADWFVIGRDGDTVVIRPRAPLPSRCLLRPAALFGQKRGFPDVNTVMGRLLFLPGATESQSYTPYTRDPHRRFEELFVLVEPTPTDDLLTSSVRWRNYDCVARRLLDAAQIPWEGLNSADVEELAVSEPWQEPLEGCVLCALAQWTHQIGCSVIEIGSLRGQSMAMLARGLRASQSDSMLVSVDPHEDQSLHRDLVRLAVSRLGQQHRLVQLPCRSDAAWPLLRPGSASLVFIDGDHSYDQVVADFNNFGALIAPGGCLVFHDYGYGNHNGQPDVVPDVRRAIDAHVMQSGSFRPLLLAHTLMVFLRTS